MQLQLPEQNPTRAQLAPIVDKIKRLRPLLSVFSDLWIEAYSISAYHRNLPQFEKILFGDVLHQGDPSQFTAQERRTLSYFYLMDPSPKHERKNMNNTETNQAQKANFAGMNMEVEAPANARPASNFFSGAAWDPTKTTEEIAERSKNPNSYSSSTIRGKLFRAISFGEEANCLKTERGDYLLPSHGGLNYRLKNLDLNSDIWVQYKGKVSKTDGNPVSADQKSDFIHSYEVMIVE